MDNKISMNSELTKTRRVLFSYLLKNLMSFYMLLQHINKIFPRIHIYLSSDNLLWIFARFQYNNKPNMRLRNVHELIVYCRRCKIANKFFFS